MKKAATLFKLEARDLCKQYGSQRVLDHLNLVLEGGELVCLLGQNGAGKTTLLRGLSGLQRPTSGGFYLDDQQLDFHNHATQLQIGLVMHQPFLYEHLTALENLRFYARLYQTGLGEAELQQALARVGLGKVRPNPVRGFSRGMKQRLTIARALLPNPKIILMDEPYSGLDQQGCQMLNTLLREEQARGCVLLVTTHELSYALQTASRFDILARGKVAASLPNRGLTLDSLQQQYEQATAKRPANALEPA